MIHHTTQRFIWIAILTGRYLLLAWFSMGCLLAAEPIAFDSLVSRVTVYPEWAYVTRSGAVALEAGLNRVVLAALPAWIDDESLKVTLDAPGNFVITAANTQTVYLHQFDEAEVRQAKDAVTDLRDHIEDLQTQINVLAMEQRRLENLVIWKADKIPHESAARKVDPNELRAVGAFMSEQLLGNLNQQNVLRRKRNRSRGSVRSMSDNWRAECSVNESGDESGQRVEFPNRNPFSSPLSSTDSQFSLPS